MSESNRSRHPLVIALVLAVLAALVMWSRIATQEAPRSPPPPESPDTKRDEASLVRVRAPVHPRSGARVRAQPRAAGEGAGPGDAVGTDTRVLEGLVVGEAGQPVEGAEVTALGRTLVVPVLTGPGGAFSLDVPAGSWLLKARHGTRLGRAPGLLTVGPGEARGTLRIALGVGTGLTGTVTEARPGTPVPGARLIASPVGMEAEVAQAVADARGRYTLELPPGDYDVVARAPRLSRAVRTSLRIVPGPRAVANFQLQEGGVLSGRVRDSEGRPVEGAYVRPHGGITSARTDARGDYRLEGLEVGSVLALARSKDSVHWTTRATSVKAGGHTHLDFTLAPAGSAQGPPPDARESRLHFARAR